MMQNIPKLKKMYEEMYLLRVFMNVSLSNLVFKLNVSNASASILLALLFDKYSRH
jgi:hypothetical protein